MASAQYIPSELILHILKYLTHPIDLLNSSLTCKSWSSHALELLWYKPNFTRSTAWHSFCYTLNPSTLSLLPYTSFVRRINLSMLASEVENAQLATLSVCERLERVTLTGCHKLTDEGIVAFLGSSSRRSLVSMDLSDVGRVTDVSIHRIAETCPNLQGLNLSMCKEGSDRFIGVTDESIVVLAQKCPGLRRIKLNNCVMITDASAKALAQHCPALLEIDLMNCEITNDALFAIFQHSRELREFRVNQCTMLTDAAFTQSAFSNTFDCSNHYFDQLRILDLTAIYTITDDAVRQIVASAPKIRNLVLNKCHSISDDSVLAICLLGRYLHYLCLGHCGRLTDASIVQLARHCTRIRYLDLACCVQLTDRSVTELATLPKLKRIGLVKCTNITDQSIYALTSHARIANSLERVHLSYCTRLTLPSIMQLVNFCEKLTHLSLTQVPAFLRPDFQRFRRTPPKDFTPQQRNVFCVFSGKGVRDLRAYFNTLATITGDSLIQPSRAPPVFMNLDDNPNQDQAMNNHLQDNNNTGLARLEAPVAADLLNLEQPDEIVDGDDVL